MFSENEQACFNPLMSHMDDPGSHETHILPLSYLSGFTNKVELLVLSSQVNVSFFVYLFS